MGKAAKKKGKAKPATKAQTSKRSKFSVENNSDVLRNISNPVFGNPTAYLYGKQAIDAKKRKKSKRQNKTSERKSKNNSNFGPRKRTKRGQRIFIPRFPAIGPNATPAPWFQRKKNWKKKNKSTVKRKIMKGAFSFDESALKHFNAELREFATYVTLTKDEIKAREYLIKEIQKSCKNLFGVEDSQCQVFGSFAARPVCIFESDIDLAIWGVVDPDSNEEEIVEQESRKIVRVDTDEQSIANQKKQERVLKWKALIDNATGTIGSEKSQDQKEEAPSEEGEVDEAPLFVIDRTGDDTSSPDLNDKVIDLTNENENDNDNDADAEESTAPTQKVDPTQRYPLGTIVCKQFEIDGKWEPFEGEVISYDPIKDWYKIKYTDGDEEEFDSDEVQLYRKQNQEYSSRSPRNKDSDCSDAESDGSHNESADKDSDYSNAESDGSHSDSADKLENFWSRKRPANDVDEEGSSDEEEEKVDLNDVPKGRPRGMSLISLSSDTTCSVGATLDDSGMEVSFVVGAKQQTASAKVGPSGTTRTKVVNALYKLAKPLRRFALNLHVRKKARVPIINMATTFGFECDIALGGHNGTDTSSYATTQLSRFKSFSTLVVFLKVLLNHQGLDKPFTGGLGSYTLYVLVASHIEQHLEMGGADDPAELLFSFFFRYGGVKHSNNKILKSSRTRLSQDLVVQTADGGSADLKSCFQIENCITIFEMCWQMLQKRLRGKFNGKLSVLQYMIDAEKLKEGRDQCQSTAQNKLKLLGRGMSERIFAPSMATTTSVNGLPRDARLPRQDKKKNNQGNREAQELIRGYGQNIQKFMPVEEPSKKKKKSKNKNNKKKRKKNNGAAFVTVQA